ncbi:probable 2-oxoglutarate-dependent dioxygenase AOP1 [Tripterygium wilfordii]|uniref:probable 2-oxoglutarate-dependent dioxygenase AOP1 n=1 Tax=Tripterygium wilfordii TaxID=458696 RepID=UPI0018F801D7|nr:probable 2-oxoglutarate-dependent dioxygenase AOP1 [Tripterygium wilfordii]
MGSQTPLKLPVIDFTTPGALKQGSPEWDSLKVQVREALKEYGCFEAVYDGLPPELRKSHFGVVEELFNLPTDVKKLNVYEKPFHGYRGHDPTVYETMGVDRANVFQEVENFTNTLWPQGNPNLSKTIHSFSRQVAELDGVVRRMLLESLGIEKYWEEHINSSDYVLRVNRYLPSKNGDESHLGVLSHTDKTLTSILFENEVGGLEIQTKQGDWISVKLSSNSVLFMVGEALYAWANGHLHDAAHRVMMRGNITRYSTGLFTVPRAGYMLKVPKELVDEEHPLQFKPFDFFKYLNFFLTQQYNPVSTVPEVSNIKAYCGIGSS